MQILPGTLAEVNSFLRIEQEAFPVDGYDLKLLRKYIKKSLICLKMVNDTNSEIIGYFVCSGLKLDELEEGSTKGIEFESLAILPAYQGKGYGTQFMHRIMDELSEMGVDYIELQVDTSNGTAIHLYENFGFQIMETLSQYYNESGHDAFVMVWKKQTL